MTARCEMWRYSFLAEAAAEAREQSDRYWAAGGPADKRYPLADDIDLIWPLRGRAMAAPTKNNKAWIQKHAGERG